ncbi:TetR/AcrR family transcriptional regulator [Actinotignum sp. GS-2025d]|uniref:TetR/AcrR family transcriptional regulator n=1 Tax=Actinotignum sp. GS-2025d TaxID=3427277 RepID=UPI003F45977A
MREVHANTPGSGASGSANANQHSTLDQVANQHSTLSPATNQHSTLGPAADDPRARRSYDALVHAAGTLIDSGAAIDDLTVSWITREAGVTRPTFYQHFSGISELVRAVVLTRLHAIFDATPVPTSEEPSLDVQRQVLLPMLTTLLEHRHLIAATLTSSAALGSAAPIIAAIRDRLLSAPAIRARGRVMFGTPAHEKRTSGDGAPAGENGTYPPPSKAEMDFASMVAAGLLWRVLHWMTEEPADPNDLPRLATEVGSFTRAAYGEHS